MKFNAEVQVEYMLEGFSEELIRLVREYKQERNSDDAQAELRKGNASTVDDIYRLTESYVRAKVVAFIPVTYAKSCIERIYIKYFESLNQSPSDNKEEVQSHFLKIINTEIDHEIVRMADEELNKMEMPRAREKKEIPVGEKTLDIKMTKEEALALLDQLLTHLPDFCAYDISLYYVQKLSIPEIAKITNVKVERVNKKLEFGRQHIKNQLRIMQNSGELNTFGLSLQKFFDWLVEFESTDDVLDGIKKHFKIGNQKNIDIDTAKQRYKNVLIGSYEEDTEMNRAFESRLRIQKKEKEIGEKMKADGEGTEKLETTITEEEAVRESDIASLEGRVAKPDVDFEAKAAEEPDVAADEEISKQPIVTSEETFREPDPAVDEEISKEPDESEMLAMAVSKIEDLDNEETDNDEPEPTIEEKKEKQITVLLLTLIGMVGAAILYFLIHLLR